MKIFSNCINDVKTSDCKKAETEMLIKHIYVDQELHVPTVTKIELDLPWTT